MRKRYLLFSLICFVTGLFTYTNAQSDTIISSIKNLEIPSSPGFVLLDVAPSVIEHPANMRAFATSIVNTIAQSNGIPKNYAVEFTPFWFRRTPNMTSLRYFGYNKDKGKQIAGSDAKFTSISLAYSNTSDSSTGKNYNNISSGLRTTFVKIRAKEDLDSLMQSDSDLAARLKVLQAGAPKWDGKPETKPKHSQDIIAYWDKNENDPELIKLEKKLAELSFRKPIFSLDGAAAVNMRFTETNVSSFGLSRAGIWTTLAYSQKLHKKSASVIKDYFDALLMVRYLYDNANMNTHSIDAGGKLEFEFSNFSFAGECIYRFNTTISNNSTLRGDGILKCKVMEGLFLTASFGKNFGSTNNLLTTFGINWGISNGSEQLKKVSTADMK